MNNSIKRSLAPILGGALVGLFSAGAQTTNALQGENTGLNSQTNDFPAYGQGVSNLNNSYPAYPAAAPPMLYGGQVFTNYLGIATPTVPGSGRLGSPLLGTSSFGSVPLASATMGPGGLGVQPTGAPGILRWGLLDFHPNFGESIVYETGIGSAPGQRSSTVADSVSAGLGISIGDKWALNYSSSMALYSGGGFHDEPSHAVALTGSIGTSAWPITVSQSYTESSTPLVETGVQTSTEAYATSLGVSHQLGSRLSFSLGADQTLRDAGGFNNIKEWSGFGGANYSVLPQLSAGFSAGGGLQAIDPGSDITFESVQGVFGFNPGARLSASLSGGIEEQQFATSPPTTVLSPIFSASLGYRFFQKTVLTISAARSVNPSFFSSQDTTSTTFTGSLSQPISPKLSLSLVGGYGASWYAALELGPLPSYWRGLRTATLLTVDRDDTFTFASVGLRYSIFDRLSLSAFYMKTQNSSSQDNFSFASTQLSFQLSYQY